MKLDDIPLVSGQGHEYCPMYLMRERDPRASKIPTFEVDFVILSFYTVNCTKRMITLNKKNMKEWTIETKSRKLQNLSPGFQLELWGVDNQRGPWNTSTRLHSRTFLSTHHRNHTCISFNFSPTTDNRFYFSATYSSLILSWLAKLNS